jgi:HAE1 family hydrophobic/amphiphilic exporter-1
MSKDEAIKEAGIVRLRPILMTSFAMIGGMLPIALGLHGEVSKSRTAMGIAVVGGLLVSTFVTIVLVPAIFSYIENLREWLNRLYNRIK